MNIRSSGGNIKLKMCRKVEIFDKRMVLGVVVPQIVPQMMQFKQFHQYQIDMNAFGNGNLSSIHLAFRHLIDFLTVQHQVGCKSIRLIKTDLLMAAMHRRQLRRLWRCCYARLQHRCCYRWQEVP